MKLTKEHLYDAVEQLKRFIDEINTHVATVNEVHNYSTEEHVVGTWTDGKPLYQKTIKMENITLTPTSEYNIDISNLNIDVIASSPNGYIKFSTSMPLKSMRSIPLGLLENYSISIDADRSNLMLKRKGSDINILVIEITIQYTKTTDSPITPQTTLENAINNTTFSSLETQNKDLVGAINEVNKSNTYSTEEQVVGTWVDGKSIYQKTIHIPQLRDNGTLEIDPQVNNLYEIIDFNGYCRPKDKISNPKSVTRPLPNVGGGSNDIRVDSQDGKIRIITFSNWWSNYEGWLTIRYTKTTD